jgi:RimJ/RimL family protein N-acetyltransferase
MTLAALSRIEGPALALRLIRPDDADYVHGLRTDPAYNQHLSKVTGGVGDQRRWIEAYKAREAEGRELYYIVERRRDGAPCGTVRLYDIGSTSFTWGSWILDRNKPRKAALESAVLSFGVGFRELGLRSARLDARAQNSRALAFYRRLGMTETARTETDVSFIYPLARFDADRFAYLTILEQEAASCATSS